MPKFITTGKGVGTVPGVVVEAMRRLDRDGDWFVDWPDGRLGRYVDRLFQQSFRPAPGDVDEWHDQVAGPDKPAVAREVPEEAVVAAANALAESWVRDPSTMTQDDAVQALDQAAIALAAAYPALLRLFGEKAVDRALAEYDEAELLKRAIRTLLPGLRADNYRERWADGSPAVLALSILSKHVGEEEPVVAGDLQDPHIPAPVDQDLLTMLGTIDNGLRNGSWMTNANLGFQLLCQRLHVDRDKLRFEDPRQIGRVADKILSSL